MAIRPSAVAKRQQRRKEHARKGGLATKVKHGREHYVRIGKLGGRPTFQEAVVKAKEREAEAQSKGVRPGRPRKAPPAGETKDMPAETETYQEPIPAEPEPTNSHQVEREHPQKRRD